MASNIDPQSSVYKRVSKCIANIIRFHRANASKEGLVPQVIVYCYRLRHRWSPKAQSYSQIQKEEVLRRVLDQMIQVHILVEVSQIDISSGRNLSATVEKRYILNPSFEAESCGPGASCDDLLISGMFRSNQQSFEAGVTTPNNLFSREYVSMKELEPNASRFLSPVNTNILGSSSEIPSTKRRRTSDDNGISSDMESSQSGNENEADSETLVVATPATLPVETESRSSEITRSNEAQTNAEKLAHEVANLPWLTQGLVELSKKYPDDQYELVYENDLLQIKCHDCKGRLYKVHYQNCDVSNLEFHARSTVHADKVEKRIAEAGGKVKLTNDVKKRQEILESAKKTAPHRFRKSYSRHMVPIHPAAPKGSAPQHPGSTWNTPPHQEMSQQLRTHSQYQHSSTSDQNSLNSQMDFQLDSPTGSPPTPRQFIGGFNENGHTSSKVQQLESRVEALELENNAHEQTIAVLQSKLRTQQQVIGTHQSVIKDLIQRVEALERNE